MRKIIRLHFLLLIQQIGTLTGTPPNIAYTPATNYNGNDTLFFRVSDSVLFDTGRVVVTVTPVNDAPIITNDASGITNEDVSFSDTLTATDVDNTTLSFKVLAQGIKGTLTITDSTKGLFTYTPNLNANEKDTMRFRVSDETRVIRFGVCVYELLRR